MPRLQLIGVGSADSVRHFNTNAVVEQSGSRLLIDAGHTVGRALAACQLSTRDIDAVWITHCHADHIYGLERLGSERLFAGLAKPLLYLDPRLEDELWEHSLKGSMGAHRRGAADTAGLF